MWFVIESVCYYFVSWSNRKHVHPANSERKARYEECSLITLQLYYLFSFGKYTAKIHIVQFTIYSVFVTTYLGKQLLLSCTRCRVLQLFFFLKNVDSQRIKPLQIKDSRTWHLPRKGTDNYLVTLPSKLQLVLRQLSSHTNKKSVCSFVKIHLFLSTSPKYPVQHFLIGINLVPTCLYAFKHCYLIFHVWFCSLTEYCSRSFCRKGVYTGLPRKCPMYVLKFIPR